jgi:hypothetical protein
LHLLGHDVAESTVARYMVRRRPGPPSQTWRSFLKNHMTCTAACDFVVVPTITSRLLYCFVVLGHGRRRIVRVNVTSHPTAEWAAQQIVEAFPSNGTEPRFLLRDRDSIYGGYVRHRVRNMGINEVLISPRSAGCIIGTPEPSDHPSLSPDLPNLVLEVCLQAHQQV